MSNDWPKFTLSFLVKFVCVVKLQWDEEWVKFSVAPPPSSVLFIKY